jgi:hypothetical protein
MRGFFRELKKRRVYRAAIAYGVAASALVQQLFLVLIGTHLLHDPISDPLRGDPLFEEILKAPATAAAR